MSSINIQGTQIRDKNYLALQITNYSIFRSIKIKKQIFMKQLPRQNFEPDQVVFIKDNQKNVNPAKIIKKSCYGTYKVRIYGSRQENFASQYQIEPFSKQRAMILSVQQKKNKKFLKFLKSAQKDQAIFLEKMPQIQKLPRLCKQQQQQMEEEVNHQVNLNKNNPAQTRYQAMMNIKISNVIEDFNEQRQIACVYVYNGQERTFYKNSKQLLMTKLQWALQDIYIEQSNQNTQITISEIMDTDFIEPMEYVTTELFDKLGLAIEFLKKNKKAKLKNYLIGKQSTIIAGVENYLNNYSLFLRVKQNFDKWANGTDKTDKDEKVDHNLSLSYLDLIK